MRCKERRGYPRLLAKNPLRLRCELCRFGQVGVWLRLERAAFPVGRKPTTGYGVGSGKGLGEIVRLLTPVGHSDAQSAIRDPHESFKAGAVGIGLRGGSREFRIGIKTKGRFEKANF